MDTQTIRILLLSAGWKERQISEALASETLDVPVPLPPDTGSAKDAFFHLLTFTTLYASVASLIVLAFQYIDLLLPDPALFSYSYDSSSTTIRWFMAVLLISSPLFLVLSRLLVRSGIRTPEKLHSGVRKWLTYLTLFVTACAVIGDSIALLFSLLQGNLTLPFLCKSLAVFALTAGPFAYYFYTLKISPETYASTPAHRAGFFATLCVVLTMAIVGFALAGGPGYARLRELDEARVTDLRTIQRHIVEMVYGTSSPIITTKYTKLPSPLPTDLLLVQQASKTEKLRIEDPVSAMPYRYTVAGTTYSLCAVFDLPRDESYDVGWNHPAGEHCFSFDGLNPVTQ